MRKTVLPLKIIRIQSGLRQMEVAKMLGQSFGMYNLRENGNAPISPSDAQKLSKILKTPIEVLFPENGK